MHTISGEDFFHKNCEKQIHWPCAKKVLISKKLFNDFSEFAKKTLSKD